MMAPLGRGGRGEYPSGGGVANGGLWWPEGASKVAGISVEVAATVVAASPKNGVRFLVCGEFYGDDKGGNGWLNEF